MLSAVVPISCHLPCKCLFAIACRQPSARTSSVYTLQGDKTTTPVLEPHDIQFVTINNLPHQAVKLDCEVKQKLSSTHNLYEHILRAKWRSRRFSRKRIYSRVLYDLGLLPPHMYAYLILERKVAKWRSRRFFFPQENLF